MEFARCEMMIGFLVPHRCPNPATGICSNCGGNFCDEHLEMSPNGLLCPNCQTGDDDDDDSDTTVYASGYSDSDYEAFDSDEDEVFVDLS